MVVAVPSRLPNWINTINLRPRMPLDGSLSRNSTQCNSNRPTVRHDLKMFCTSHRNFVCSLLIVLQQNYAKGALLWNSGGGVGLFFAVAVPIELDYPHVFISFNFEASRPLPKSWFEKPTILDCTNCTDIEDAFLEERTAQKPQLVTAAVTGAKEQRIDDATAKRRIEHSLLSRTSFYDILKHKFEESGFEGNACLLRMICETNASEVGSINGVLGNLVHILFSPSSSMYEALPTPYYEAELQGRLENCTRYEQHCKRSVLDIISKPLTDFVATLWTTKLTK